MDEAYRLQSACLLLCRSQLCSQSRPCSLFTACCAPVLLRISCVEGRRRVGCERARSQANEHYLHTHVRLSDLQGCSRAADQSTVSVRGEQRIAPPIAQ
eukprot:7667-Heterococcus_DN1.PRE.1